MPMRACRARSRALHTIPEEYMGLTLRTEQYVRNFVLFQNPMLTASQVIEMTALAWKNTLEHTHDQDLPNSLERPQKVDSYVCRL